MTDPTAPSASGQAWHKDLIIPVGIVGVVLVMILPLPSVIIDLLLAASICLSLCILLVSIYLRRALDLTVFPTLLLVATLFRLALNIASTRLILLHGAEGSQAAGAVIESFGAFVIGGSTIVGVIIFLILVLINFMVITKGSGRIAEVAARFTLDALPGRQMAIDADLASGLISEQDARVRREELQQTSDFYGAMDGASKFVKGDAKAGLVITGINVVGGLILGVFQEGLEFQDALSTYTLLTVGDGLASQIPSLLVSVAAGLIVSRASGETTVGERVMDQIFGVRKPLAVAAGILLVLAVVPGMPTLPFLVLSAAVGFAARKAGKKPKLNTAVDAPTQSKGEIEREQISSLLPVDLLELEVGYELVSLVDPAQGGDLVERMTAIRRNFAQELGLIIPPVHIRDNLQLQADQYRILLSGSEVGGGQLKAGRFMAMEAGAVSEKVEGQPAVEPAFGLPALWIASRDKERAEVAGYTVVDSATVVATHLTEIIRRHSAELLGRAEAQELLDTFARTNPRLVEDLVPGILSLGEVVRVLRGLLDEGIGIRDMRTILETLADHGPAIKDADLLTELVRQTMSRSITDRFRAPDGRVEALVLDANIENMFREHLAQNNGASTALAPLPPTETTRLVQGFERASRELVRSSMPPVLVTAPDIRRSVLGFVQQRVPGLQVVSYREIESGTPVKPLAIVSMG